jgi:hypothetical protein
MQTFIRESAAIARLAPVRFGYSPEVHDPKNGPYTTDPPHTAWAKSWMAAGDLDYVVPELYYQRSNQPTVFQAELQRWITAASAAPNKPFVAPGLLTLRVQVPDGANPTWSELEIRGQMEEVRSLNAAGEAHYGASALRTSNEGGPRPDRNLADKLTAAGGHYEKPVVPPNSHIGDAPAAPAVRRQGNTLRWHPTGGSAPVDRWIVLISRNGQWEQLIPPKNNPGGNSLELTPKPGGTWEEEAVYIRGVTKRNNVGDPEKWEGQ